MQKKTAYESGRFIQAKPFGHVCWRGTCKYACQLLPHRNLLL